MRHIEETLEEIGHLGQKLAQGPTKHMQKWCKPDDWQHRQPIADVSYPGVGGSGVNPVTESKQSKMSFVLPDQHQVPVLDVVHRMDVDGDSPRLLRVGDKSGRATFGENSQLQSTQTTQASSQPGQPPSFGQLVNPFLVPQAIAIPGNESQARGPVKKLARKVPASAM